MTARVPGRDCPDCPRLVAFRDANRRAHPDWHNAPVDSFGPADARLLIVGLAPGLRGANRTARPFTGDFAGDLLFATLRTFEFARGDYDKRQDDGLELIDCRITNGVRCVPPENKPVGAEIASCRPFLVDEIESLSRLEVILALGTMAHATVLTALGEKRMRWPFGHGAVHLLPKPVRLVDSYHCSRYNTNTGRLTEAMFHDVFRNLRTELGFA